MRKTEDKELTKNNTIPFIFISENYKKNAINK
jgi:hypothetical protein